MQPFKEPALNKDAIHATQQNSPLGLIGCCLLYDINGTITFPVIPVRGRGSQVQNTPLQFLQRERQGYQTRHPVMASISPSVSKEALIQSCGPTPEVLS